MALRYSLEEYGATQVCAILLGKMNYLQRTYSCSFTNCHRDP